LATVKETASFKLAIQTEQAESSLVAVEIRTISPDQFVGISMVQHAKHEPD
jgi:hypothetical protein